MGVFGWVSGLTGTGGVAGCAQALEARLTVAKATNMRRRTVLGAQPPWGKPGSVPGLMVRRRMLFMGAVATSFINGSIVFVIIILTAR